MYYANLLKVKKNKTTFTRIVTQSNLIHMYSSIVSIKKIMGLFIHWSLCVPSLCCIYMLLLWSVSLPSISFYDKSVGSVENLDIF